MNPRSDLNIQSWVGHTRVAMSEHEIEGALANLRGWSLKAGAIEKCFSFANYFETMAFVNAVALVAHTQDHHPELAVTYNRCVVRLNTHDVGGVSETDFGCAQRIEATLK